MEKKDYPHFLKSMVGLAEVLGPKELSETILEIYWQVLKELTLDQFNRAVKVSATSSKFFPKPAELLAAIAPDAAGQAVVAFDRAAAAMSIGTYKTVCFDDPAINATIASLGGWIEFGQKEATEWLRKDFQKIYEVHYKRIRAGDFSGIPTKLPGIIELSPKKMESETVFIGDKQKCLEWTSSAEKIAGQFPKIEGLRLISQGGKNGQSAD